MEEDTIVSDQANLNMCVLPMAEQVNPQEVEEFLKKTFISKFNRESLQKLHFLGRGTFANVFKIMYENDQQYAVKEMQLTKQEFEYLKNELIIMKQLSSDLTVQMVGISYVIESNGILNLWIILELMQMDLNDYIYSQHDMPMDYKQKVRITRQLVQGLQIMHSQNICHRDLKPGNILIKLVDQQITAKLSDFGISKQVDKTQQGTVSRTPLYSPPELVIDEKFNKLSDIWSLGLVLYELYTGQKPYTNKKGDISILIYKKTDPFEENWEQKVGIKQIVEIIKQCVNFKGTPEQRPTSSQLQQIMKNIDENTDFSELSQQMSQTSIEEQVQLSQTLGQEIIQIKTLKEATSGIFYGTDHIIIGDKEGNIFCYNIEDKSKKIWEQKLGQGQVRGFVFDQKNEILFVCGWNTPIVKLNPTNGKIMSKTYGNYEFRAILLNQDNLICAGLDKHIYGFSISYGFSAQDKITELWKTPKPCGYLINVLCISNDNQFIYAGSEGEIICYKLSTKNPVWHTGKYVQFSIRSIVIDKSNQFLYASCVGTLKGDHCIYKINATNGELLSTTYQDQQFQQQMKKRSENKKGFISPVFQVHLVQNEDFLIAILGTGIIYKYDIRNKEKIHEFKRIQKTKEIFSLSQNKMKAVMSEDQTKVLLTCYLSRTVLVLSL